MSPAVLPGAVERFVSSGLANVAATLFDSGHDDTSRTGPGNPYTLTSKTFDASKVYVLQLSSRAISGALAPPTVTGPSGVTWALHTPASGYQGTLRDNYVFIGIGSGTGAPSVDYGADIMDSIAWTMAESSNVDTSSPFAQHEWNGAFGVVWTSQDIWLGDFDDAHNLGLAPLLTGVADGSFVVKPNDGSLTLLGSAVATTGPITAALVAGSSPGTRYDLGASWTSQGATIANGIELRAAGSATAHPITRRLLTAGASATSTTSYVSASTTPTANRLILVVVNSTRTNPPQSPSSVVGNGITFTEITHVDYHTVGTPVSRLTVYRGMSASPTTGAITFTFPGNQSGGCAWSVIEYDGVNTGGTNGSGAIGNTATNKVNASSAAISVTMPAFGNARNATVLAIAATAILNTPPTYTPGAGLVYNYGQDQGAGSSSACSLFGRGNVSTPSATTRNGSATDQAAIGIELVAA